MKALRPFGDRADSPGVCVAGLVVPAFVQRPEPELGAGVRRVGIGLARLESILVDFSSCL
jgi:hypothetical protein